MTLYEILETSMLIAFSVGWYCSIWHMVRARRASGKSLHFVMLVCAGYLLGVFAKLAAWYETGELSWVVYVFAWNLLVTLADLFLVLHYRRQEQEQEAEVLRPRRATTLSLA
ncbi:MAG: hypothetical protein AAFR52_11415 [Pseudomonadota bacterium]